MPFTPAHPAIILPFLRMRGMSATALVAGSVAPDFEYFVKMSVDSRHSHTLAGLFYFDLPMVFVLAFLFHAFAKRNLVLSLPSFLRDRLVPVLHVDLAVALRHRPWGFIASAVAGAASHLLWDGFTHADTFFVRNLAIYETVVPFDGVRYPLYYALQHVSTYVGMTIVVACLLAMKRKAAPMPEQRYVYWLAVAGVAAAVMAIRFAVSPDWHVGNIVVTGISATCISLVTCGALRLYHHPVRREA